MDCITINGKVGQVLNAGKSVRLFVSINLITWSTQTEVKKKEFLFISKYSNRSIKDIRIILLCSSRKKKFECKSVKRFCTHLIFYDVPQHERSIRPSDGHYISVIVQKSGARHLSAVNFLFVVLGFCQYTRMPKIKIYKSYVSFYDNLSVDSSLHDVLTIYNIKSLNIFNFIDKINYKHG